MYSLGQDVPKDYVEAYKWANLSAAQGDANAATQKDRMFETALVMEEMNATVLEIDRNAGQAADAARDAHEKSTAGAKVVGQAEQSMQVVSTITGELKG